MDFNSLVKLPDENENLEYKIHLTEKREFVKEIVGLANSGGGTIMIGITDAKEIKGIKDFSIETITNIGRDNCNPPIIPRVTIKNLDGKEIVFVEIPVG